MKTPRRAGFAPLLFGLWALSSTAPFAAEAPRPAYLDPTVPLDARVEDLLGRMTLEEKLSLVHADSKFTTAAIPRLGIPRRWMSDGPNGVREDIGPDTWQVAGRTDDFATCMPVLIGLAATWDADAAGLFGNVIGEEARKRGKDIMLGPGVNIQRTPLNGRTSEFLGEDPYLASRMVVGYIRAVQLHGVASCVKHFAANNQETQRNSIDVEMDERTLREIYLPAFRAAVQEGGAWAVMGAYNKFRGQFCCQNDYLINRILKGEWGFRGLVMSDWGGTHDTREAVLGGLDLEMGTETGPRRGEAQAPKVAGPSQSPYERYFLAGAFREGLKRGDYPMSVLDEKVRRNLRVMIATRVFDGREEGSLNTAAHQEAARKVAEEGIVLLKNDGAALPLAADRLNSIAVIGENAVRLQAYGGDSARIKALYEVSPLEGILRLVGARTNVTYSPGYRRDGAPDLIDKAVAAARSADVAIVVGGLVHAHPFDSEGDDRKDLNLPWGQDELIRRVALANPRTIVVIVSGSPVAMGGWLDRVPAVVQAWYGGTEGGNALANVLFGAVNPSGKLPCTYPKRIEDSPAHALGAYPGSNGVVNYAEGLLVGYRWFDTKGIEPLFPFGYGLSYTRFEYSGLRLAAVSKTDGPVVTVEFEIANTGDRPGAEVAQLYIHQAKPSLPRPLKELKGFRRIELNPGEKRTVSIPLDRRAFAFYDPARSGWVAEADDFMVEIGSSSRDIRLQDRFHLGETTVEK
ncbi:MAG: glycoside hydrolase family 3 C-terminal domain-containing protein [Opitutaceae bacterium]|jgi:beta-glucosidase